MRQEAPCKMKDTELEEVIPGRMKDVAACVRQEAPVAPRPLPRPAPPPPCSPGPGLEGRHGVGVGLDPAAAAPSPSARSPLDGSPS